MMNWPNSLLILASACVILSCSNSEEIISGNIAPPDPTVSNVIKENYIQKAYISTLGRKPSDLEFQNAFDILDQDNASLANRNEFLDQLFNTNEYAHRLFDLARADLLNSADTAVFSFYIRLIEDQLEMAVDPNLIFALQIAIGNLQALKNAPFELAQNQIEYTEMQRRCLNNLLYDEINMGTENFVVSAFQNLLLRAPSSSPDVNYDELESSKMMVDGFEAVLFLEVGDSKSDFLDILIGSNNYYEAQVVDQYNRFLFRDPSSEEMTNLSKVYKDSGVFSDLQRAIMTMDEYLGIK